MCVHLPDEVRAAPADMRFRTSLHQVGPRSCREIAGTSPAPRPRLIVVRRRGAAGPTSGGCRPRRRGWSTSRGFGVTSVGVGERVGYRVLDKERAPRLPRTATSTSRDGAAVADPSGPVRGDVLPFDLLLDEPIYQLVRQQLLAHAL